VPVKELWSFFRRLTLVRIGTTFAVVVVTFAAGDHPMTFIAIIIVGGILGWIASKIMRTDEQQGIFLNIVVGIVGAVLAGFVLTPILGGAPITSGAFDLWSLLVSLLGAIGLLAIVNLMRRGKLR
jgi:uncharacterized membrane protein YeaQ/YmgE (transglycosylase-associated protein family)